LTKREWVVMRFPVLMEDEGRPAYMRTFYTEEEAEVWIASQESDPYFKPRDYYIA
jgi:hypothetical protein